MATDRIETLAHEATRERLARAATRSAHLPNWWGRLTHPLRRPARSGHRRVARHA
jgi:hypothetical protein